MTMTFGKKLLVNIQCMLNENDNGKLLLGFCCLNEYVIGGTLFTYKGIHKGMWLSPTGKTVNQIDHLCVNTKKITSLQDVRSYRGAERKTKTKVVHAKSQATVKET